MLSSIVTPHATIGEWASRYTDLGLHVLPIWGTKNALCICPDVICKRPGKHPIGRLAPRGKDSASSNSRQISEWWSADPMANIAVACGPSGLVAVDIDPRNGGDITWEGLTEAYGPVPDTWEAETGGSGSHIIFKRPEGFRPVDSVLGPGIDIKASGYVVVAPSTHVSGRKYVWLADADPFGGGPLANLPSWLTDICQPPQRTPDHRIGVHLDRGLTADGPSLPLRRALEVGPVLAVFGPVIVSPYGRRT